MAKIFISHSTNSDPHAANVRDAVAEALKALGHVPLVDVRLIDAGDRWRAELLTWLGTCDGAVILVTSKAASRDWVRTEATILGWRAWLNPAMRVVPVLLDDGASSATLDELGLKPVQLRDIQVLKASEVDDGSPASWAHAVARRFEGYRPRLSSDDPMSRWCKLIRAHLKGNEWLEAAAGRLGISEDDLANLAGPLADTVAHRLLHSEAAAVELAYLELVNDPGLARASLAPLVSCVWLPPDMASSLFELAGGDRGPKVAAVNVSLAKTPRRLLLRLTCCDNRYVVVDSLSPAGTGVNDAEELLGRYVRAVVAKVGAESEAQLAGAIASLKVVRNTPVFVLVGPDALETGVLPALAARLGGCVVVCAGERDVLDTWVLGVPSLAAIELMPRLDKDVETMGSAVAGRIEVA